MVRYIVFMAEYGGADGAQVHDSKEEALTEVQEILDVGTRGAEGIFIFEITNSYSINTGKVTCELESGSFMGRKDKR